MLLHFAVFSIPCSFMAACSVIDPHKICNNNNNRCIFQIIIKFYVRLDEIAVLNPPSFSISTKNITENYK